jgi:hypothetical protein
MNVTHSLPPRDTTFIGIVWACSILQILFLSQMLLKLLKMRKCWLLDLPEETGQLTVPVWPQPYLLKSLLAGVEVVGWEGRRYCIGHH